MITLEDCKQAGEYNYKGLSTDTKPTNCYVNSLFLELDTGIFYFFNGTEWKDISQGITLGESEPTGTITITENGIFDVHDYAEADVDVPAITPAGTISIMENGTYDVTNYAEANVDVDVTVNFDLPAFKKTTPTELSQARSGLAATTVGDYALFGGGWNGAGYLAKVDAYDTLLTRTTPTVLSVTREYLAATSVAPAGGSDPQSGYALFGGGNYSSRTNSVDAYDTSLTRTTPAGLNQSRTRLAATAVGNYALFGGGNSGSTRYSTVDAYDQSLTRTTPTSLSKYRTQLGATSVAPAGGSDPQSGYALFGGGYYNDGVHTYPAIVDAYNASLTRTTPTALSEGREFLVGTNVGSYALFGGGSNSSYVPTATVDAYNTSLTRTTPTELSVARKDLAAASVAPAGGSGPQSGYALFGGGYDNQDWVSVVDAYDTSLTRTIQPRLSEGRSSLAATSIGNYALFGGGYSAESRAVTTAVDAYSLASYDIQVFPETKYSFNGSEEQTSSTWQTISMQGEVIGYIKVKDATVN